MSLVMNNKALINEMKIKDVICLQECTSPEAVLEMLNSDNEKFITRVRQRQVRKRLQVFI